MRHPRTWWMSISLITVDSVGPKLTVIKFRTMYICSRRVRPITSKKTCQYLEGQQMHWKTLHYRTPATTLEITRTWVKTAKSFTLSVPLLSSNPKLRKLDSHLLRNLRMGLSTQITLPTIHSVLTVQTLRTSGSMLGSTWTLRITSQLLWSIT